jgi:flagellar motor switch/type III secretory pathway protein FliN
MIDAPEFLIGDRSSITNDNRKPMFPNLQLLMNHWVATQVNLLAPVELSHGILATLDLQERNPSAHKRTLCVREIGFIKATAVLHGDADESFDHWVELWHLLGHELSAKVGEHLEKQWESADEDTLLHKKEKPAQSFFFLLSALPTGSVLGLQIDIEVLTEKLALNEQKVTKSAISCDAWLEIGEVGVPHTILSKTEVGGVFVFGLRRDTTIAAVLKIGQQAESRLPVNWNLESGEITMLNIESLDALPTRDKQDRLEPSYASIKELKVPVRAYIELGQLAIEDLQNLRVHQVLPTAALVANSAVELSANGQTFAHGQLIEMNGQLCVRVTRVV